MYHFEYLARVLRYIHDKKIEGTEDSISCAKTLTRPTGTNVNTLLGGLDLHSEHSRVEPTQQEVASHEPKVGMTTVSPHLYRGGQHRAAKARGHSPELTAFISPSSSNPQASCSRSAALSPTILRAEVRMFS